MQVKDVLRAFAREYPHAPGGISSRLNDYVCDNRRFEKEPEGPESFVTLALAIVHPQTGEASVLSAGAEPPVILRSSSSGGSSEVMKVSGLPLGVSAQELYTTTSVQLEPGDILMLLTDGITEARRRGRNEFLGQEGLMELARKGQEQTANLREMGRFIMEGARDFADGTLRDDACLLLARRL